MIGSRSLERLYAAPGMQHRRVVPRPWLAVLTCMDPRVQPERALGVEPSVTYVLRNAGGRVTNDVMRSLVFAWSARGVDEFVVMHAGERVVDVPPRLSARVRLLDSGRSDKSDPHDARSAAVVALRHARLRPVRPVDHAAVLRLLANRHHDLTASRTRTICRLHAPDLPARSGRIQWPFERPPSRSGAARSAVDAAKMVTVFVAAMEELGVAPHEARLVIARKMRELQPDRLLQAS